MAGAVGRRPRELVDAADGKCRNGRVQSRQLAIGVMGAGGAIILSDLREL